MKRLPDWGAGEGRPSRSGNSRTRLTTRKWLAGTVLSALLLFAVVTVGWLLMQFLFPTIPDPDFVPFLISDYQEPTVSPLPWTAGDRTAIQRARLFNERDQNGQGGEELTLQVARERLARLQQKNPKDEVVVYIGTRAGRQRRSRSSRGG